MAASKERMGRIHEKLAQVIEGILDEALEPGEASLPLDAATMGGIRTFLKDNDITCDPADSGALERIKEQYSKASQSRKTAAVSAIEQAREDDRPVH